MEQIGRSSWRGTILHIISKDNLTRCGRQFHRPDLCGLIDSEEAAEFGIKQCPKCGTDEDFTAVDTAVLDVLRQSSELYHARQRQFNQEVLPLLTAALETVAHDVETIFYENGRFAYVWCYFSHGSAGFKVNIRWEHDDQHVDTGLRRPRFC